MARFHDLGAPTVRPGFCFVRETDHAASRPKTTRAAGLVLARFRPGFPAGLTGIYASFKRTARAQTALACPIIRSLVRPDSSITSTSYDAENISSSLGA